MWIAGGRIVDSSPLPVADAAERCAAALRQAPREGELGGWLPADELDEIRLVSAHIAAHPVEIIELPTADVSRLKLVISGASRLEREVDDRRVA